MLFELTPDQRAFREELCAFLTAELTPEVLAQVRDEREQGGWNVASRLAFRRKLAERGYLGISLPTEYGGGGKDLVYQLIFLDEVEYHGGPPYDASTGYLPQMFVLFGTEEQKRRFIPPLARGELSFFLGYSEPEAGSDLADLKTRADPEGNGFAITGQKVYSSYSHFADYGLVAARTDSSGPRHLGISLFVVDMNSPGVTIARHSTIAGFDHPAVHFDHVPVARTMLIGQLHLGWRVLMAAVDYERAVIACPGLIDRQIDRLIQYSVAANDRGSRPVDDPVVRDRLVTLAVEVEAARIYTYHIADLQARGERPQHETALAMLMKREAARLADITGVELLGPRLQLRGDSPFAPCLGAIEQEYREHLYFQFAAGGFDITRNVIAARGLKLPR